MSDVDTSAERIEALADEASFDGLQACADALLALHARATQAEAERDAARAALEIIAGRRQCADNLMSNVDVARAALGGAA